MAGRHATPRPVFSGQTNSYCISPAVYSLIKGNGSCFTDFGETREVITGGGTKEDRKLNFKIQQELNKEQKTDHDMGHGVDSNLLSSNE